MNYVFRSFAARRLRKCCSHRAEQQQQNEQYLQSRPDKGRSQFRLILIFSSSLLPLQNQNNSRNMVHVQQQQQQPPQPQQTNLQSAGHLNQNAVGANNNGKPSSSVFVCESATDSPCVSLAAATAAQMLQFNAVIQQQPPQQQKLIHSALARTTSHQPSSTEMLTWVSTLMENMNNAGHRKLERTQSEPAQVNTSRFEGRIHASAQRKI